MNKSFSSDDFIKFENSLYERYGCSLKDVEWKSWPETFPNTAGPHKDVIAGSAITIFQKFGITFPDRKYVTYCDGVWEHY